MIRLFYLPVLFLLNIHLASAQNTGSLRHNIEKIVSLKNALVGVSIMGNHGNDTLSMNADVHFPMQSVFKFHIALLVLSWVDEGKLSLKQNVKIGKKDLLPDLYSPIRDKYPDGVTLPLAEILAYTISESDNVGCDMLLRLIGGPEVVEAYFIRNNFKDVSIKTNEELQQNNWDLQFKNWTTPKAATATLAKFYDNKSKLLSQKSYDFIWQLMKKTQTGAARIKGQLPTNSIVAHKTVTSGTNKDGLTAAVNDIGIVFLPNGKYFFISVFITNSTEKTEVNEKIISDISKAAGDYFISHN